MMRTDVETHGALVSSIAVWFAMLSPLIAAILGLLGAWFFSQLTG
jgi:hypothetical protein